MIEKRKIPWGGILAVLGIMEVAAYYFSGLVQMDGVTVFNYQKYLPELLKHPFRNYFSDITLAVMGLALIAWLMAVVYFMDYFKDFHFGMEQGTADWESIRSAQKKLQPKEDSEVVTELTRNIRAGSEEVSNMNMLVIGASGSYKSTSVVTPNILRADCTNVILDIKGDLLKKYGNYLKSIGITVKSLNFRDMQQSDRYNPFRYIQTEEDMVSLITMLQKAVEKPNSMKGDPFWDDGLCLYLQAMFYYEWLTAKEENRTATMNNILKLVNMETKKDEEKVSELQKLMDEAAKTHGPDYPPVRDYRKLKAGATETVRSIVIMVNAMLRLFELPGIQRIFADDDIDIPSLGLGAGGNPNKRTALFLVLPSGDATYNLFINMFYGQLFYVLKNVADYQCKHEKLPIHVRLWADEFYAGPKPPDTEVLLGEIRSRNMSIVPALQDLAQIKAVFPDEKWEIFNGNCAATVYLGSGPTAHTTHQWISDMLNKTTIDSRSETVSGGLNGNNSMQTSKVGVPLMTADQVRNMPKDRCILFIDHCNPIYDKKNLPWAVKNPAWLKAAECAGGQGYRHPVRVIYNEKERKYKTVTCRKKMVSLNGEDISFYKEAQKQDPTIRVYEFDEEDFLYLDFNQQMPPTEADLKEMVEEVKYARKDLGGMEKPEDIETGMDQHMEMEPAVTNRSEDMVVEEAVFSEEKAAGREQWDLSGTASECLVRYSEGLHADEISALLDAVEQGVPDNVVKQMMRMKQAEDIRRYLKVYLASRKGAES